MNYDDYNLEELGLNPLSRARRVVNLPPLNSSDHVADDDIEVIDLDDRREQIKPTTWH